MIILITLFVIIALLAGHIEFAAGILVGIVGIFCAFAIGEIKKN